MILIFLKLVGSYASAFVIIDLQVQIHMPRFLSSQELGFLALHGGYEIVDKESSGIIVVTV